MSIAKTKAPRKSAGRNNGSKENAIRFCGGVYVAKNTSQSASLLSQKGQALLEQKNQVRFRT